MCCLLSRSYPGYSVFKLVQLYMESMFYNTFLKRKMPALLSDLSWLNSIQPQKYDATLWHHNSNKSTYFFQPFLKKISKYLTFYSSHNLQVLAKYYFIFTNFIWYQITWDILYNKICTNQPFILENTIKIDVLGFIMNFNFSFQNQNI